MEMALLAFHLPREELDILVDLAKTRGQLVSYTLRQCLANYKFFMGELEKGNTVVLSRQTFRGTVYRDVVFP